MRIPRILRVWPWLAVAGVLLLCLSPFETVQAQKLAPAPPPSPTKPQKPAATAAQPLAQQQSTGRPKGAPSPDAIPEDGDYLKEREEWFLAHRTRSEEHTSELQPRPHLVCRPLLQKKT